MRDLLFPKLIWRSDWGRGTERVLGGGTERRERGNCVLTVKLINTSLRRNKTWSGL